MPRISDILTSADAQTSVSAEFSAVSGPACLKNMMEEVYYITIHSLTGRNPGEPCAIHGLSRNCEPHGAASQIPAPFKFPPPDGGIVPETQDGEGIADSLLFFSCRSMKNGRCTAVSVMSAFRHKRKERTAAWL